MSQESSISRMQELEIEKEKVYSRMDFWNSQSSWVLFSLFINLLRGWHSYLLCFLYFSLDGRNVAAATNTRGKQEWQQCCLSSLPWSANIQKKEISFCALFVFVFPFQSEQEAKIKRLCNMISQQAEKTQAKKRWQGFVHFFIHSLWICYASFWPAT
mgnify:CR=1 FL=1